MAERQARGTADASDLTCAAPLFAWFVAAIVLIVCHVAGVRPGDGILADLPRLPTDEEGFSRLTGEALVLAFAAASALVPAGLVVAVAVLVTDRLRVPEPAGSRLCVGLGFVAYVAYLAAIVLHSGWGWFVVAAAGPVAVTLVVLLAIGWLSERRDTRRLEGAREQRVQVWRRRWEAADSWQAAEKRAAEADGIKLAQAAVSTSRTAATAAGGSLADEAAAWRATESVEERTVWRLSRPKCAAWGLGVPIVLVLLVWSAFAVGYVPQEASEDLGIIVAVAGIFGVIALAAAWEYGRIALLGGGFEARPEGLLFRFGTTNRWFAWSEVGRIAVEKRKASTVLVIEFPQGGMRWPRSFSLSTSDTGTLCVSSQVFADPVEGIAKGICQAKYRFRKRSLLLGGTPDASQLD